MKKNSGADIRRSRITGRERSSAGCPDQSPGAQALHDVREGLEVRVTILGPEDLRSPLFFL